LLPGSRRTGRQAHPTQQPGPARVQHERSPYARQKSRECDQRPRKEPAEDLRRIEPDRRRLSHRCEVALGALLPRRREERLEADTARGERQRQDGAISTIATGAAAAGAQREANAGETHAASAARTIHTSATGPFASSPSARVTPPAALPGATPRLRDRARRRPERRREQQRVGATHPPAHQEQRRSDQHQRAARRGRLAEPPSSCAVCQRDSGERGHEAGDRGPQSRRARRTAGTRASRARTEAAAS